MQSLPLSKQIPHDGVMIMMKPARMTDGMRVPRLIIAEIRQAILRRKTGFSWFSDMSANLKVVPGNIQDA
ncbi:hypothetical protein GCM10009733_044320 [Nonomuraea maheshkhaliensis]|uniref:Uncharacterized protein n=1 Tax=Nonomuraea maheshkhaliensis TaxID=419590 RepID=A0ABP4RBA4_9ACTN